MTRAVQSIPLDKIIVQDRLRDTDAAWVSALAASIRQVGLLEPILVRKVSQPGNDLRVFYVLVAGAHRLAAVREAGLEKIDCHVSDLSEDEARLAEIDENLMRRELCALDRAVSLAERQEVYERLHPASAKGGDRKSAEYNEKIKTQTLRFENFTEEAAEKTGLSRRTIQDAIALAKALSPELRAEIAGTDLAKNAAQLKALTRCPPSERLDIVRAMKANGKAKVIDGLRITRGADPDAPPPISDSEKWIRKFWALWAEGQKRWKDEVLRELTKDRSGS